MGYDQIRKTELRRLALKIVAIIAKKTAN